MKYLFLLCVSLCSYAAGAQNTWHRIDSLFGDLPPSFHVFKSNTPVGGEPNVMYYVSVPLKGFHFTADTSMNRRLTPDEYYSKNGQPLLVVNAGFFTFADHRNLNAVVQNGRLVGYNAQTAQGRGADTGYYLMPFYGTFGIRRNGTADIAWTYSDSARRKLYATQTPVPYFKTTAPLSGKKVIRTGFRKWKVETAVGGGPVLVQNSQVRVTNNEERKFAGKAIDDRHPRTGIGYTPDGRVIVFVCEGRSDAAAGLTLTQMARVMQELGCEEALNLDGGGSTSLLVNGREVNTPSSKGEQRPVPSVFIVK